MENDGQYDHTIDVLSAGSGSGNHLSEGNKDELGMGANNIRQDLLASSSGSSAAEFELLWRLRKYLVMLGVLAVSVTYTAGLTPPGGFWTLNKDGHHAGDPVLHVSYSPRYEVFFYCNATAFAASLVLVILLLSKSVARQKTWLRSMQLTMLLDLFSLLGAFAAGSCRAPKSSIYIWILVFAVFVYVAIHTLVSRRVIPDRLIKKLQALVDDILSKRGVTRQASSHPEKDIEEARKFILMLVTFAATITYQAGLNPPGGFWAENQYDPLSKLPLTIPYKHRPATSVLQSNYLQRYKFFVSCNATSFVASLVTIILLLSPELSHHEIRSKAVIVCVVVDLLGLIGAYAAGCCRSVGTSLYVVFITVIVWICFALLAAACVRKPVADCLGRIKCPKFIDKDNSHTTDQHTTDLAADTPTEDSASVTENRVQNIKEGESDRQKIANTEETVRGSEQPSVSDLKSENTTNSVANDAVSATGDPPIKCQQATNTVGSMPSTENKSADNQQAANKKEHLSPTNGPKTANIVDDMPNKQVADTKGQSSSTDELNDAIIVVDESSEQTTSGNYCKGATNDPTAQQVQSDVPMGASGIEIVESTNTVMPSGNGNVDKKGGLSEDSCKKNSDERSTLEQLKKSRTYLLLLSQKHCISVMRVMERGESPVRNLLLLAILAVSLTYQSDSNDSGPSCPNGGLCYGKLQKASNSMYISSLACLVLAYVGIHVLIATHVIPKGWKERVAKKLKLFSCKHLWPELHQSGKDQSGDVSGKEWERRRNLLLILSVLAATVTYQAGMSPPGGVWSDDKEVSGTPGNPVLQHNHSKRYDVFYYSNSATFMSSVVITIPLVNKKSCENGIKSYALRVCLVVGLVGLLIAYAAGSCRRSKESIYLIIIAAAVLISLVIQVLILSSTHDTVGGPWSKCMERLLKRLLRLKDGGQQTVPDQQGSLEHAEKNERKRHKYLMLLAVLAASITYQAGLNPPGGFWYDDPNHVAGNPVLHDIHPWRYRTFFIFNGISFMASIVVIMFLLEKSERKKVVTLEVLHLIMILDLLALMTAFAAGSCRKFRTSMYVYVLIVAVVVYLVLAIGVASSIAKCLKTKGKK
ncbi:hypothetical protein ZWY2020_049157 [Hordeum vulgare]|nr:hypothetical protein ZWY2020_049157 [Hordeum vulgare]